MSLTTKNIYKPFCHLSALTEIIRFFTPNWFAVTMGTGVLALVLAQATTPETPLFTLARTLWGINIGLFLLFMLLYVGRWLAYPQEATNVLFHPQMSMFLGTIPMGLATIINGFISFGLPLMGATAVVIAHQLWKVDAVLAILCGVGLPLIMFTRQSHQLSSMTALWLLPIVAAEVAAVSGLIVAPHIADPLQQQEMVIFSMLLWAFSVPTALSILAILWLRMALHKLPPITLSATTWLALGPIGTGALGMFLLSQQSVLLKGHAVLGEYYTVLSGVSWVTGILLWGLGAWWLLLALGVTAHYVKQGIPFNLGCWGYTFPLGVFTLASFKFAQLTSIAIFSSLSLGLLLLLAAVWGVVMAKTLQGVWSGRLFVALSLQNNQSGDEEKKEKLS